MLQILLTSGHAG